MVEELKRGNFGIKNQHGVSLERLIDARVGLASCVFFFTLAVQIWIYLCGAAVRVDLRSASCGAFFVIEPGMR
jgi:hypothetical protein